MRALLLVAGLAGLGAGAAAAAQAQGTGPICGGPRAGWHRLDPDEATVIYNRIGVFGQERLTWNGEPVTRETLLQYLWLVSTMRPLPLTVIEPVQGVDCAFLDGIRDDVAAVACGHGLHCLEGRVARTAEAQAAADLLAAAEALEREAEALARAAEEAARNMEEAADPDL